MTEDQAITAVGHLVGGMNGFNDAAIDEYVAQFEKLDDADVLDEVCQALVTSWQERWKPTVADVLARYHDHPTIRAEREARVAAAMLAEGGGGTPTTWGAGQAIARDQYRALYGRNPGDDVIANPVYAAQLIEREGHRDLHGNWLARYVDVLRGFHGDQMRAQRSLHALGRRLDWDNRGRLTLKPDPEPGPGSLEPRTPPPAAPDTPEPSESLQDATMLMRQALGDTVARITE